MFNTGNYRNTGSVTLAFHPFAHEFTMPPLCFRFFTRAAFRRFFEIAAKFHFAEYAFALHFFLQSAKGLIDIIVAYDYLYDGSSPDD